MQNSHPEMHILKQKIYLVLILFPPPSTASVTQQMYWGVIRSLKANHRKHLVRVILTHLSQDKPIPKISLLKAMQSLDSAWNHVSKETVIYCFQKANFSKKDQMSTVNDVDNLFKDLNKSAKEL